MLKGPQTQAVLKGDDFVGDLPVTGDDLGGLILPVDGLIERRAGAGGANLDRLPAHRPGIIWKIAAEWTPR